MIKNGNILNTIQALYHSLTKSEKKIADLLLDSPDFVSPCSLAMIASHLQVGEATIVRFCRTIGFSGFSEFKLALSIELATKEVKDNDLLESEILPEDDSLKIAYKLQNTLTQVIEESINLLDIQQLDDVVNALLNAKRIFLFGVGSSGITAEEAKNKFMRIGLPVDASGNNHFMYMQAALLKPSDVAIGISHSGYSMETTKTLEIAYQNGATTIALTHNLRSPITQYAHFVLANGHNEGKLHGDSIGTKIAQLFVLDLIYALLIQREQERATQTKQKTLNVILAQRIK